MGELQEREHAERTRIKLFASMPVAYGYALLGGALWEPLTKAEPFTGGKLVLVAIALAMHGYALYIAPRGEAN